jgi:hypothetical protein
MEQAFFQAAVPSLLAAEWLLRKEAGRPSRKYQMSRL